MRNPGFRLTLWMLCGLRSLPATSSAQEKKPAAKKAKKK